MFYAVPTFHTSHTRSVRGRLERDREYEEYLDREHLNTHLPPLHQSEEYRERHLDRIPSREARTREEEFPAHRGSSRRALNAIQWRLSTEQPIEEEIHDELVSPNAEGYYRPQIPYEYRDDRIERERRYDRYEETLAERKRLEDDKKYSERDKRYADDYSYDNSTSRRYPDEKRSKGAEKSKLEGKNYRKELLERFADMDVEDRHEFPSHQRYYE